MIHFSLKSKLKDCDGASIRIAKLPGEAFEEAKNLKIISRHGVGYDNIDLESTKKNNITLTITATANAVAVAEHVMFMLLNISKKGNMYDETVKSGKFNDRNKLPKTVELWNKNILIAGFGRIGQALIKRCHGFEMKVFVYDPFVSKEIILLGNSNSNLNFSWSACISPCASSYNCLPFMITPPGSCIPSNFIRFKPHCSFINAVE